jgi:hypothetical protein
MSAGKEQQYCYPVVFRLPVVLILIFSLLAAGQVFAAGSPFEIEIGDLERGDAGSKELKKPQKRPVVRKKHKRTFAVPQTKVEERQAGGYIKYTIRPGDHIFKILTMHFGLSSAKAEELIPEIKRINGIVDTSGLQIGQTLLLPLARKKDVAPPVAASAPVPAPVPLPAPAGAAESQASETPPALPPRVDEGLLRRVKEFWARLFPERKLLETAAGKEAEGSVQDSFLVGVNGKEIRIVPPGTQPVFGNMSGAGAENGETVVADPANEKGFVKELLQAAGFATTDGGVPLEFGTEPKLLLKVDFTAAQRIPGAENRKTILVLLEKNGCQVLPESFVSYLAARNFRVVAWCDMTGSSPVPSSVKVLSTPPGGPDAMVDTVLEALGIQTSKDFPIEIVVGQTGAAPLSVTVDRYFEGNGKRFFVDFGTAAPNRATLFRLLELAGYQRIGISGTDDLRAVAAKISLAMNVSTEYRPYRIASQPDGLFMLELPGVFFQKPGTGGEKTLLLDHPLEQPFSDLLKDIPWGTE